MVSLLVAELDADASSNKLQHLVKYIFSGGNFIAKEKILSVPMVKEDAKGSFVRFDSGDNKIYRNRYVVTGIGNIIDTKNKKLLLTEKDQFVKFEGDSVVFFTNDIFKGKYYSVYNLKTETYSKVNDLLYNPIPGRDIEFVPVGKLFQIWMYDANGKKKILVNDAGETDALDKKQKYPPVFWLDNDNFIYAKTSWTRAEIIEVDCYFGSELKICEINSIPRFSYASHFSRDSENNIIYSCAGGDFMIDVKSKRATKNIFQNVGNGFAIEEEENPTYGRRVQFFSTDIGKYWTNQSSTKTIFGHLAIPFDIVIQNQRYPQGVAVWNSHTKQWKELEGTDSATVIGWVEE